jgi:hypothetical protein
MSRRLYLKVGDKVNHIRYSSWGIGEVIEEKHSHLAGGFCLVRILFADGEERSFNNDIENTLCCYYAGVKIIY